MLALSTGLQILMLFLIWFSLCTTDYSPSPNTLSCDIDSRINADVQASTVNYNILVITFSIPPILTFVIFRTLSQVCALPRERESDLFVLLFYFYFLFLFGALLQVFWPFERGDVLSGVLALLLSATTFCLCTELWQGISLDTSKDVRTK